MRFPKPFVQRTESDADGFTVYRRMEDGRTVMKKKTTLDNGFIVPYNRILLSKYRSHINIELCNQNKSIKYMFKYVNKGHDRVMATFYETRNTDGGAEIRDEIKMYYDCRYLSAGEAMSRLFNFDIHYRNPLVIRLSFHLPDHQPFVFNENQSLQSVLDRTPAQQTMFLSWFCWVDKLFGGKVVVLGGDFRQILPVVLKASRQDIVYATINSSPLWNLCCVMKLNKNMRLQSCSSPSNVDEIKEFGDWILKDGNEDDGKQNDGEASIEISDDMLIGDSEDPFRDLLEFIYPDLLSNMYDPDYFQGRAILAPTNECVESVNDHLMSLIPREEKVYLSSDSMCRDEQTMEDNAGIYSTEFLNTIRCSGLRSHALKFKVGAPVMLIKNIDQARGLCNGTRIQIGIHVLSCKIIFEKNIGDMVFIPQMTLIPSNSGLSVKFQRRQFTLIVSFAMTINKSQGQTLSHVGLYLPRHVFSHDQLYVALSSVTSRGGIKIFIKLDSGELTNVTRNVVYKEVLHRI
ncbi:PREDICTED: uncharacterized protein LOC105966812 [Erythranthe guttata]|uniref:uncharacterized protein LOC105966812 n=1 Tax=Erythranthe guttata TaxID=4155 RepID=UPI00064DD919|nr:PREDICTED: uncharacterized protein LOC105966812 [Erythranthe guttata]|eukprot:XP_012846845.1 PREDICTED: uncharacterized protein LOC105966812 [Erythranthe guttata]